ncbi:MAG: DUF3841 domain-containing protein [Gudongella sp.]|nr:DUF3841 domain-containing protein [Gudongella sp.]
MTEEKTILWTRQDERSLLDLEKYGVFRNKKEYIEANYGDISYHFISLYRWFTNEASKRVPTPEKVEFPIWCSISEDSMLRPTEGNVCYKIEIPKKDIIYFDGAKWDHVLNHIYIPKDDADQEEYVKELKSKGFKDQFNFIEGKTSHFYPLEKKRVMDSWQRIFEIERWNIFIVQANIWEIRPEQIKEVFKYEG